MFKCPGSREQGINFYFIGQYSIFGVCIRLPVEDMIMPLSFKYEEMDIR